MSSFTLLPFHIVAKNYLMIFVSSTDGYQATDVYYKWNSRNSTGDVVYIAEDLEMPQFMITKVELEERTNIYNIGIMSRIAGGNLVYIFGQFEDI